MCKRTISVRKCYHRWVFVARLESGCLYQVPPGASAPGAAGDGGEEGSSVIYLFLKVKPGEWWPAVFGYQHHWPHLRQIIWSPWFERSAYGYCDACADDNLFEQDDQDLWSCFPCGEKRIARPPEAMLRLQPQLNELDEPEDDLRFIPGPDWGKFNTGRRAFSEQAD